jgi:hypothetical protein
MSVRAMAAVWDHSEAPNLIVLMVALVLADHADHDGLVWLSVASVENQARVSRASAYRALHTLEDLGELVRVRQGGKGRGDTNTYRLALVDNLPKRGSHRDPLRVSKGSQKGLTAETGTYRSSRSKDAPRAIDAPDVVAPVVVPERVADIRTRLGRPSRGPA